MKTACLVVCLVVLGLAGMPSCSGAPSPAGTYEAAHSGSGSQMVALVLSEGGKGSWSLEGETVDIGWEVRRGKLQLHTRTGGLITGTFSADGAIDIHLPGVGPFRFIRRTGGG